MKTIASMVPVALMLLFMVLYIQQSRLLRESWAREHRLRLSVEGALEAAEQWQAACVKWEHNYRTLVEIYDPQGHIRQAEQEILKRKPF